MTVVPLRGEDRGYPKPVAGVLKVRSQEEKSRARVPAGGVPFHHRHDKGTVRRARRDALSSPIGSGIVDIGGDCRYT